MRQQSPQLRKTGLLAMVCAIAITALACAFALPGSATADEATAVAYSVDATGAKTEYMSISDAVKAGCGDAHPTIVMARDWEISSSIEISAGKKLTIDMHGYSIKRSAPSDDTESTIDVKERAELTLTSSVTKEIAYKGYDPETINAIDVTATTGGLVTQNAPSCKYFLESTIVVYENGVVNLEGVAVAGNKGRYAGGLKLYKGATLNMSKGASVDHNWGGGVEAHDENVHINMDASSISYNTTENSQAKCGGGIHSEEDGCHITMTNGSKIDHNVACAGGGIYFSKSKFELTSSDGTGVISNNKSIVSERSAMKEEQSGGGIHVDQRKYGKNSGLIEGITICGNYSAYDGGGIELDQESTTIKNCVIKDNWCKYEGGGIYVCNDKNTIEGCTITGNACNVNDEGKNYEGGGVFVWCDYDVELKGVCVIKGNTRGKGTDNADDVFLRENAGATAKAYITGSLSKGSSVGVRSGVTGDRRVAKNFKHETNDCLFYDMDGYYVSYGNDSGGDAWQRHRELEFAAKLNGETKARYKWNAAVTLVAPAAKDDGKVFWRWDAKYTTGLYPVDDYLTERTTFNNALSFPMPQNDVNLVPVYVDPVRSAMFAVEAPVAGKALSTTGQLVRTDGGASGSATVPCSVYWYEVGKGGEKTQVAGVAKAGTTYEAYVSAPKADVYGLYYDDAIGAADVIVRLVSSAGETVSEAKATKAYVTLSHSLAAFTATCETGADAGKGAKTGTVEVQMKNKGLLGEGEAAVAALADDGDDAADESLIGTVKVSYAYNEVSDTVTISAPAVDGYNFCNWEVEGDAEVSDEGTVTIPVADLLKIKSLTATYTPVATALEVKLEAPKAGDALAATCTDVTATCSDGETVSLAEGLDVDSFDVIWSPEPEDGKAGFSTSYTALIKLCSDDGFEDVEKALASGAAVTCNGVAAEAAGFTVADGNLCLAVSFPATRAIKAASVTQPDPVEVSFEDAAAGNWQLPKIVLVTLETGETVDADVTWAAVNGFNSSATAAQELQVKGTITHIAYDGDLDDSNLSRDVTLAVKVSAPEQQATKKTTTETTTTKKKGTPATGDTVRSSFAALLTLSATCLAAARFLRRSN